MKLFSKTATVAIFGLLASALRLLAQADEQAPAPSGGSVIAGVVGGMVGLIVAIVMVMAAWKIFTKAGQPGWKCLIPIYNTVILLRIVGRPAWWLALLFIPFVNFVIIIMLLLDLAKSFGKTTGFGVGLICLSPIFYPILGFGESRYVGPAAGTLAVA